MKQSDNATAGRLTLSKDGTPSSERKFLPSTSVPVKRYGFKKRNENSGWQWLKSIALFVVVFPLVLVVALVAYGFIHNRPIEKDFPWLGPHAACVQIVVDYGCCLRARCLPSERPIPIASPRCVVTNTPIEERATNVVNSVERIRQIESELNDGLEPNASQASLDVEPKVEKCQAKSGLKSFYNGGRKGRKIGEEYKK